MQVAFIRDMKMRLSHILFLGLVVFFIFAIPALADNTGEGLSVTAYEYKLLRLINQARVNPLKMAEFFGLDSEELIRTLPELKPLFDWGVPPLNFSVTLRTSSENHAMDMLKRGYYNIVSPEGSNVTARAASVGYYSSDADELLGILLFSNFYEQEKAVNEMFRKMFLAELTPGQTRRRVILNPTFKDLGMNVQSGKFSMKGNTYNAYIAVCDFGTGEGKGSELVDIKAQLFQMINQTRNAPERVIPSLYTGSENFCSRIDDKKIELTAFSQSYYPYEWSSWAACVDTILQNQYADVKPLKQLSYRERIAQYFGCGPADGSTIARYVTANPNQDVREIVQALFDQFIGSACDPDRVNEMNLLNPEMTEAGISIRCDLEWLDGEIMIVYTASLDVGKPAEPTTPAINGAVFTDTDGNGLYSPGEGLADVPVIIFGAGLHLKTDSAGGFESSVPQGAAYRIICFGKDGDLVIAETDVMNNHKSIFFNVSETGKGGDSSH